MGLQEFVRSLLAVERPTDRLNLRLRWRPPVLRHAPGCPAGKPSILDGQQALGAAVRGFRSLMAARLRTIWSSWVEQLCPHADQAEESILTLYVDGNAFLGGLKQRRNESPGAGLPMLGCQRIARCGAPDDGAGSNASKAAFGSTLTAWLMWLTTLT
jgi:hypothetical protein